MTVIAVWFGRRRGGNCVRTHSIKRKLEAFCALRVQNQADSRWRACRMYWEQCEYIIRVWKHSARLLSSQNIPLNQKTINLTCAHNKSIGILGRFWSILRNVPHSAMAIFTDKLAPCFATNQKLPTKKEVSQGHITYGPLISGIWLYLRCFCVRPYILYAM